MLWPLFFIPLFTLFIITFICFQKQKFTLFISNNLNTSYIVLLKLITLISFNINLCYGLYIWKKFPYTIYFEDCVEKFYPSFTWFEAQHSINLPFLLLSIFVLSLSLLVSWYSSLNVILLTYLFLIIEFCLVGAFLCTNLFLFLLFFEASAFPIFILIVYCGSFRKERLKASYYFLFFTLYGSLSLLLLSLNTFALNQLEFLNNIFLYQESSYTAWILLFIAFAVKVPLFPFHVWLPHAHVEASTATSIILAALMLKLGGYGILKFMLPLFLIKIHFFFKPFAVFICLLGVVYGGIITLRQLDLKRQIAFSSISHMSFSILGIFTFTEIGIKGSIYLMLSHGFVSASLFYLIGVLSDRHHTRSVLAYGGLLGIMPLFSGFFILNSLANIGFPGTSGFLPELFIFISFATSNLNFLFLAIFGMILITAGSLVMLLRLLFGHLKNFYFASNWVDLSKLEFAILCILGFWVLFTGMQDVFFNT